MLRGRSAECAALDRLLQAAQAGQSQTLVLRGEPGVGKTALLDYLAERAGRCRLARAAGFESEMELPFAGLHQLCLPFVDRLDRLPPPQAAALATAFGIDTGEPPSRFLLGAAVLGLLNDVAEDEPLVCIVDDVQWLDDASAQILVFVARRLLAERIAMVCAARVGIDDDAFSGLEEMLVHGLADGDARALLQESVHIPLDAAVAEQIVAESHGNPLALLELPRTWKVAELAGGFALPTAQPVVGKIERSYAERLRALPGATRLLVLAAAAEPLGDPVLLARAVEVLGVGMTAAGPAVDAALLETDGRIEFTHPLVRSAAYGLAATDDRQRVHHALAEATDSERDPDRRAWHRARATSGPDEDVAADLERSAGRAQARGGVAAAAAFLERAAALSQDPTQRARRALAAAEAKELAGAPQSASTLLANALNGPLGERERALGERLKGQIALDLMHVRDAVPSLLQAADRLRSIEPGVARDTYLEAIRTAVICGRLGGDLIRRTARAARDALPTIDSRDPYDSLLAGMAVRYSDGYAAGADRLKGALDALRDRDGRREPSARWPGFARAVALDLFDDEACHALATRSVEVAREQGALGALPLALDYLAILRSFEGDLRGATAALEESDAIADASGAARIGAAPLTLAGFRGDEAGLLELVQATEREVRTGGAGTLLTYGEHALAVLLNAAGRYDGALEVGQRASERDELVVSTWALPEVIEAAARCGRPDVAGEALERLTERTQAAGTELALGIEARSRALLSEGSAADDLYREAVERLSRCRLVPDHARAHLTYGEWLRRAGRRVEARSQLRAAYERFVAMETEAFAERARRELVATGERVRKRTVEMREQLTAQEAQIAQLASDGETNQEIGAQLYLSPRTVEWHLHKAYTKLGVASRRDLRDALERASAPSR